MAYGFAEHGATSLKNNRNLQEHIHEGHFERPHGNEAVHLKNISGDLYPTRKRAHSDKLFRAVVVIGLLLMVVLFILLWRNL